MNIHLPRLGEHDKRKLDRLLTSGELLPVMNNTKWGELVAAMQESPQQQPEFRVRGVLANGDFVADWDGEWHYHINPVAEIEWVELRANSEQWLVTMLNAHSIPYSLEAGVVRVWGYVRPGAQPSWQGA
jgi:hypothetical protein